MENSLTKLWYKIFGHEPSEHQPDYVLIGLLVAITFIGLLLLSSASSVLAFQKFNDSYYFLKHQITRGLIPGLILFFFLSRFNYKKWKKYAFWLLLVSLGLLILVFIPGIGLVYNNARSWAQIGPISFQPAEIVKLTFLIYLATWLDKKSHLDPAKNFLPFISLLFVIIFLMLAQPDTGTLLVLCATATMVYFASGVPWKYIAGIIGMALILVFLAIQIAPYRLERLTSFLNPENDPQGTSYHINQAKLAIGSGGLLGLGIGKSRQKFNYLPEVSGDSIFAIIAEEMGFIFSIILVFLFLLLMVRGFKIARAAPDNYGRYLALGIIVWFSFQSFVNIAGIVGLIPLTGVTLPFISYGGTSLVVNLAAAGILVNISKFSKV